MSIKIQCTCGKAAIPDLIKALGDPRVSIRAQEMLRALGQPSVQPLAEALKDEHELIRKGAAETLKRFGPDAREAIPALAAAMREDVSIRWAAALALEKIGEEAVPALSEASKDRSQAVRVEAVRALGKLGEEAVPPLIEALKDREAAVRGKATEALGNMGRRAGAAVPELNALLNDPDEQVRWEANRALKMIRR